MALYCCKGASTVMGVHGDDQFPAFQARTLQSALLYGVGTYIIVDIAGPAPTMNYVDPPEGAITAPPIPIGIAYPTMTPTMHANSIKLECRLRILEHISEQAQRNINNYISEIQNARMTQSPTRPPTSNEQADMNTSNTIFAWIGRPNGMQGACDAMIAGGDLDWYTDVKWPPWNSAWDAFVVRF